MKRINHYVLNGAIALLSTAGLVACSSSDDVTDAPVNPTYDGKSVKTQFAINIATPSNGKTRMSAENTQASGSQFLGMKNIYLLPITGVPTTSSYISKAIPLDGVSNTSSIENSDALSSSQSSTVYSDVNVPVGTDNFLFYGTSPMGTTPDTKFNQGVITNNLTSATTVDNIHFDLEKISRSGLNAPKTTLSSWLKSIAAAKAVVGSESVETNWASLQGTTAGDEVTLKQAYSNFTSLKAGSAAAILETVHRLYDVCYPIFKGSGDYQKLAQAIITAIQGTEDCGVSYTEPTGSETHSKLEWKSGVSNTVKEFPTYQNFPDGSMVLTWSAATPAVPSYVAETQSATPSQNNMNVSKLCYPAPVAYYANTPLRSSDSNSSFNWPVMTTTWDANNNWSGFSDNVVKSTTSMIALRNNINYGVASLQTSVICKESTLLDNADVAINVTNSNVFPVTGIIIGGQPESVKWNYVTTATQNEGIIYDKNVVSGMQAAIISDGSTQPTVNYTLVFDNYVSAINQEPVSIAIELVNNTGVDFKGQDGIVADGQKFYLVGRLEIENKTLSGWPVSYDTDENNHTEGYLYKSYENRYPVEANTLRVFIQDYTTVAKFTINSLKNAYVTIPDLRASKLQLGLSVDLEWKTGLTYDVTIE
ncbi:hypothetical protein [Prevotella sp. P2-180]|uniref:hypothetical protein n=1 Tax=Prevotella sp. P2-180 TaxID=2024224 RepID=UPI000B9717D8|nr:hypothetical protein [Prevotella sp. P2-180]OYP69750.1 hypothetical protein CIK98_00820 [Prevotella sp. P2-180]